MGKIPGSFGARNVREYSNPRGVQIQMSEGRTSRKFKPRPGANSAAAASRDCLTTRLFGPRVSASIYDTITRLLYRRDTHYDVADAN
jgi:hypothetical protein